MGDQRGVRIHEFNTTSYAYDQTQVDDDIHDGDVIIAKGESAIAILDRAWPFAITAAHGEFHGPPVQSAHLISDGRFVESLAIAMDKARELGFPIHPLNAPVITVAPEPEPVPERVIPCPSCEGYGGIPIYHASLDGIIGWRKCPDRHNHPVSLVKHKPEPAVWEHVEGCDGDKNVRDECCPPF
jgi:hypothetical protein